jgi:hypothetical protein
LWTFLGAVLLAGCAGLLGKLNQLRGGPGRFAELWPCFPAALALVLVALFVLRYFHRVRRRTIQAFKYVNGELTYRTAESNEWVTQPVAAIRHIGECPGTRGPHQIKFVGGPWIVLSHDTINAAALVERLNRDRTQ